MDVGTSGGVWGLERGYCMMIGGEKDVVKHLDPIFSTLAPGIGDIPRTPGREKLGGTAEQGYLHCGPNGAGHFVKMVHNGIEYGIMAAYAEGLGVLRSANIGKQDRDDRCRDHAAARPASTTSTTSTSRDIAEVWRRGSVIASWLLDLTAAALVARSGAAANSPGESPIRAKAAGPSRPPSTKRVPAPVLTAALYERFSSRGEADFADKLLSAMRYGFGGHLEKPAAANRQLKGERNERSPTPTPWSFSAPPATWPTRKSFPRCRRW